MPFGTGTPCKKHGYPCLEPCPVAIHEENEALRELVINLRDDLKQILNLAASAPGAGQSLTLSAVEIIATAAIKRQLSIWRNHEGLEHRTSTD